MQRRTVSGARSSCVFLKAEAPTNQGLNIGHLRKSTRTGFEARTTGSSISAHLNFSCIGKSNECLNLIGKIAMIGVRGLRRAWSITTKKNTLTTSSSFLESITRSPFNISNFAHTHTHTHTRRRTCFVYPCTDVGARAHPRARVAACTRAFE